MLNARSSQLKGRCSQLFARRAAPGVEVPTDYNAEVYYHQPVPWNFHVWEQLDWKDVWMIEDHYSHYPPLAQTRRCHLSWQQHAFWLFGDAYAVHNFLYHAVYLGILGCQQTFLLLAIPCHQPCLRGGPGLPLRSPAVVFGSHGLLPEKATSGMLSRQSWQSTWWFTPFHNLVPDLLMSWDKCVHVHWLQCLCMSCSHYSLPFIGLKGEATSFDR